MILKLNTYNPKRQLNIINLANYIKIKKDKPDVTEPYLKVLLQGSGDYVWLMPSNNYTDDVDVLSNVVWEVN